MKLTSIADLETEGGRALRLEAEWSLSGLYDEFLDTDTRSDEGRAAGIHASELATCRRQVVYSLYNTPKQHHVPRDFRKRFKVGQAIHSMLQSDFHYMVKRKGGKLIFQDEVSVNDTPLAKQYDITSSCDGLFTFLMPDEHGVHHPVLRIGLEIKTESPDGFASLKSPRPKHIEQTHIYMACLDLPLVWFLYWNKGNQNYTKMEPPWLMPFDKTVWNRLKLRTEECRTAADSHQLPDKEEGFHCSWCPYAYTCGPKQSAASRRTPLKSLLRR